MHNSRLKHNLVIASLLLPVAAVVISLPGTEQSIEIWKNGNINNMAGVSMAVSSATLANYASSILPKNSKCLILTQTIEYQSTDKKTNKEVTKLQQFLYDKKYLSLKPDGLFGLSSVAALKKYQFKSKIPDVGYLDAKTKKMIQADTCSKADNDALAKAAADAKKAKLVNAAKGVTPTKTSSSGTVKVTTTIVQMKDDKGNIIKKTVSSTAGDKSALGGTKVSSSATTSASRALILNSEKLDSKAPFKVLYPQGYEKIEPFKSYGIQWSAPSVSLKSYVQVALVNVKKDEIEKMDNSVLADESLIDFSSISEGARAIDADVSGIPNTIINRGGYTWSVPAGIPAGTGYRIYVGDPETGKGTLNDSNFWMTGQIPKIAKTRVSKIQTGYLVNISGTNFASGLSVKFTKNGRSLLEVDSKWVQVIGSTEIQLFLRNEDMTEMPIGALYSVSVFNDRTEIESETADIAFWQ